MSVSGSHLLGAASPLDRGERRFRVACAIAAGVFCGYLLLTVAGAPAGISDIVFQILVFPVPIAVWAAYFRSPRELHGALLLFAWAATLWLVGSIVWYGFYLANSHQTPTPPGIWDAFFIAARLLVIAAILLLMQRFVAVRLAALDTCIVAAAGIALGAGFIGRSVDERVSTASLLTLNRPVLGIVTLMLIASAGLGTFQGLLRSIALFGVSEVCLTVGSLIYSYEAVQGQFVDNRWANVWWGAGAELTILAALVFVLRVDRPVQVAARQRVPGSPTGARMALLFSALALATTLAVATWAELTGDRTVALIGLIASIAVGLSMALRARDSMRAVEDAYLRLDHALLETEHARDELAIANEDLARANAQLQAMNVVLSEALNVADE